MELIESENEQLKKELEEKPSVLSSQLSLLDTQTGGISAPQSSDSDLKSNKGEDTQKGLTLSTAKPTASKPKKNEFETETQAIAVKGVTNSELSKMIDVSARTILDWSKRLKQGDIIGPSKHKDKIAQWKLGDDNLWYKKSE